MNSLFRLAAAASRGLALALGFACLVASAGAQFGRFDPWLDLLAHFALLWLGGAVVCAVVGVLASRDRARRLPGIVGALGILAAGALMAPEILRPLRPDIAAPPNAPILRLIQFNAWDENADPAAAADWIASRRPDLVLIDELTPALRSAMETRGFRYQKGMVTTAIFSRGLAPAAAFRVPVGDWPLLPDFARAAFVAPGDGRPFTVVAVHLTWPTIAADWFRRETFARLLDDQPRDRLIIAGDFNLTPWSFALRRLDRRLGLERRDRALATWPARRRIGTWIAPLPPVLPIDHVYAGPAWRTVAVRRGPSLGSDHYPVEVDLVLAR